MKPALITGCDKRYLPLLLDLLQSLKDHNLFDLVDAYVFDLDFTSAQIAELETYPVAVRRIENDPLDIGKPDPLNRHLVSSIRPMMRELFPGHSKYIYLDVDVWVQDPKGIRLLIEAADSRKLVVAPQIDRAYTAPHSIIWSLKWRRDMYAKVYGKGVAHKLLHYPSWNGGVLSLHADSPAWDIWREAYRDAVLAGGPWFGAGQAVLAYLHAMGRIPLHPLPAVCNWLVHLAQPMWHRSAKCFVTPIFPHERILLLHQTADTKDKVTLIPATDGTSFPGKYSYSSFRELLRSESLRPVELQ